MYPEVQPFFHAPTETYSYVVADPETRRAAVIDPVLDFSVRSGRIETTAADELLAFLAARDFALDWILETHAHADHLTAAAYLKEKTGARLAIGAGIRQVQATFKAMLNLEAAFATDGSQFDHLFTDGERFHVGAVEGHVMATPGHTSDSVSYLFAGLAFIGDTLFMPDYGSARCDFPGGDARLLYRTIQKIYAMPPDTRLYLCHDYAPNGRAYQCQSTVTTQRSSNIHARDGVDEDEFASMRVARDRTLEAPHLLYPSVQVNIRAGELPPVESNGRRFVKIPLSGPG